MDRYEHVSPVEALRLKAGLAQREVSARSGIDQRALRYAEQGEVEPRLLTLQRLAAFYDVELPWLINEIRAFRRATGRGGSRRRPTDARSG